ncbi:hypothetical protein UVI_02000500 [Ustilaginoidea virens]|uniref:Uncharacterized protein n=1 Tax=Ustilaginoidea virens TaxID=1159556 RepID=A0A1B5L7T7_USTVR|nr:hypothetical protein UVI_02000500 [Ustilaginoidea virens]
MDRSPRSLEGGFAGLLPRDIAPSLVLARGLLFDESLEKAAFEPAEAADDESVTAGRNVEPNPVLPAAKSRQMPSRQRPEESWVAGYHPGVNPSACPFPLFSAPTEVLLASSFLLPPWLATSFSWLPRIHAIAGEEEEATLCMADPVAKEEGDEKEEAAAAVVAADGEQQRPDLEEAEEAADDRAVVEAGRRKSGHAEGEGPLLLAAAAHDGALTWSGTSGCDYERRPNGGGGGGCGGCGGCGEPTQSGLEEEKDETLKAEIKSFKDRKKQRRRKEVKMKQRTKWISRLLRWNDATSYSAFGSVGSFGSGRVGRRSKKRKEGGFA